MKIAILRALYLGDMLCIIPTVRAIRKAHPQAEVHLVGLPWQKDFVKRFSCYFDHFVEFPGWPGLPEREPIPEKVISFLSRMQSMKFDLVLQMQGNGVVTNSLCMLWNAKTVCGLRKPGEYAPVEKMFPVSEDSDHEVLRFFKLLECLGIQPSGSHLEFRLLEDEETTALKLMAEKKVSPYSYVCIHPGARDARRRWPAENFAFIANKLAASGSSIVLTGSGDERDLLTSLEKQINSPVLNIVEAFGHLGAGELAAILRHSRLLLSNDTGVSHIAAGLGVPSVVIFSPYSEMSRWRPLDASRHTAIAPEQASNPAHVLKSVDECLNRNLCRREMTVTSH